MFVLSFKNGNNDPTRDSFNKYCMALVEIKDFNALIDRKPFFYQPVKSKQEAYKKPTQMSRNDKNMPQQMNFVGKLEEDDGATIFLLLKSSKKQF